MAIIVNTNVTALRTQNNLNKATNSLNSALQRMSTGLKINSAADDAAGYFVATKLAAQINGSKAAQSNVATGINLLQTVEGNLDVINDNMLRIRDLAVQGANGVYDANSYKAMSNEIAARAAEIDRISKSANFNGKNLIDGTLAGTGVRLQVGSNGEAEATATANLKYAVVVEGSVFAKADTKTLTGYTDATLPTFTDVATARKWLDYADKALTNIATRKATIGAVVNRLNSSQDTLTTTVENASAAKSTIMDADIASESANYTKSQILQQTSATLLVQANQLPSIALTLIR